MLSYLAFFNVNLPNEFQNFATLVLAICVEAFPFIIIGVVCSTIIEIWVPTSWIQNNIPKNRFLSHLLSACLGFLIPVCECGNVPFVRKMMQKGFSVSQSLTFLLSAPIVNPIVWITTTEAFNLDRNIATIRVLCGLFIAIFLGILFSYKKNPETWLHITFRQNHKFTEHNHHHNTDYNLHQKNDKYLTTDLKRDLNKAFNLLHMETWQVFQMLLIAAIIAATIQTFVPRQNILLIGQNPVLSVLSMLVLAFIVSMCSSVDAFFALSLSNSFTLGAIMTFLVFGPMIDIKVLAMLRHTFKFRFMLQLTLLVAILCVIIGFAVNIFYPRTLF